MLTVFKAIALQEEANLDPGANKVPVHLLYIGVANHVALGEWANAVSFRLLAAAKAHLIQEM